VIDAFDALIEKAKTSYKRECPDCDTLIPLPDIDELLEGETACPNCGQVFDVDSDDRNFFIAFLIARVERLERLERRTSSPFDGIDL
jgi:uncharacterized paraquat-inducible protein A